MLATTLPALSVITIMLLLFAINLPELRRPGPLIVSVALLDHSALDSPAAHCASMRELASSVGMMSRTASLPHVILHWVPALGKDVNLTSLCLLAASGSASASTGQGPLTLEGLEPGCGVTLLVHNPKRNPGPIGSLGMFGAPRAVFLEKEQLENSLAEACRLDVSYASQLFSQVSDQGHQGGLQGKHHKRFLEPIETKGSAKGPDGSAKGPDGLAKGPDDSAKGSDDLAMGPDGLAKGQTFVCELTPSIPSLLDSSVWETGGALARDRDVTVAHGCDGFFRLGDPPASAGPLEIFRRIGFLPLPDGDGRGPQGPQGPEIGPEGPQGPQEPQEPQGPGIGSQRDRGTAGAVTADERKRSRLAGQLFQVCTERTEGTKGTGGTDGPDESSGDCLYEKRRRRYYARFHLERNSRSIFTQRGILSREALVPLVPLFYNDLAGRGLLQGPRVLFSQQPEPFQVYAVPVKKKRVRGPKGRRGEDEHKSEHKGERKGERKGQRESKGEGEGEGKSEGEGKNKD
jgi:hypothetical protein